MERTLLFKQLIYDTKYLKASQNSVSFFTERDDNDESVTALTEDEAIKWLFTLPQFKELFLEEFFENPSSVRCLFGVTDPITTKNKKPGDIDLLLIDPASPHRGIAFECKRVKAISSSDGKSKVNNVEKIRKGVTQANGYHSLGFFQSYLLIIILDDARELEDSSMIFRRGRSDEVHRIYNIPWREPLHPDVGIAYINVNQISGSHITNTATLGLCIDKRAIALRQTTEMTNRLKDLIL